MEAVHNSYIVSIRNIRQSGGNLETYLILCFCTLFQVKVDWFKDSKPFKPAKRHVVTEENGVHKIVFKDVTDEDVGTYTMQVRKKSTSAKLIVQGAIYSCLLSTHLHGYSNFTNYF